MIRSILMFIAASLFLSLAATSLHAAGPAISAGEAHSLFLKTDGTVWATGGNYSGELGNGTTTDNFNPEQVLTGVQVVSAGGSHSLFLKKDGTVWAT
jgi:alpha-tubulin suppressor-like RCC1 family protein